MTLLELDILLPVLCLKSSEQRHSSLFSLQICCCVGFFWFAWGCGFSSSWLSKLTAALQNFTGKFKALSCLAWLCSHLIACWVPPKAWSFLHPWGFCWWFQGQQEESQGRYFTRAEHPPALLAASCPRGDSCHPNMFWCTQKLLGF